MGIAFRCVLSSGGSGSGGTLTVIGSDVLAGITCTCTDGVTTLTETFPSSAPYNVVFQNLNAGSWTVSVTYHGDTHSETVVISLDRTVDLGIFHLEDWLAAGEVTGTYSTLAEVLADELAVRKLCLKHNPVDYLTNRFVDTNLEAIFSNDLFAKWTNNSDYALDKYATVSDLVSLMEVSHKVPKPTVPTMTSNTTPSGTVLYDSSKTSGGSPGSDYYKLFSGTPQTVGVATNITSQYFGYDFTMPVTLSRIGVVGNYDSGTMSLVVEGSDDGTTWNSVSESISYENSTSFQYFDFAPTTYRYWRINATKGTSASIAFKQLQFYAYEYSSKYNLGEWILKPQVPTMTSNTAPSGEVIYSTYKSGYEPYKAFDGVVSYSTSVYSNIWASSTTTNSWIGYDFKKPVIVKRVWLVPDYAGGMCAKDISIQAYDGNDWIDLKSLTLPQDSVIKDYYIDLDNNAAYTKYRVFIFNQYTTAPSVCNALRELQFYAYEPKGNVPVMTSNTAPYGTASGRTEQAGYEAYKAFNGNLFTPIDASNHGYATNNAGTSEYLRYAFTNPVKAKKAYLSWNLTNGATAQIQGSNDGETWEDVSEVISMTSSETSAEVDIDTDGEYYLQYQLKLLSGNWYYGYGVKMQYYGRELSVSVPTMTGNTTPYGEVIGTSGTSGYETYKAFDKSNSTKYAAQSGVANNYIGYSFVGKIKPMRAYVYIECAATSDKDFKIQGLNDDTWEDLADFVVPAVSSVVSKMFVLDIASDTVYSALRLFSTQPFNISGQYANNVIEIGFYGLDYSEKEFEEGTTKKWLYDHGLELEPMESLVNSASNPSVTKNPSDILLSGYVAASLARSIDLTAYSLLRVRLGNKANLSQYTGLYVLPKNYAIGQSENAAIAFTTNVPDNVGLSVSSFNEEKDVGVLIVSGTNQYFNYEEFWLE